MDERIRMLIESGASDGAKEVYQAHEAYEAALKDAEANYNNQVAQINQDFADSEKLYALVQSVTNSIISKFTPKENV